MIVKPIDKPGYFLSYDESGQAAWAIGFDPYVTGPAVWRYQCSLKWVSYEDDELPINNNGWNAYAWAIKSCLYVKQAKPDDIGYFIIPGTEQPSEFWNRRY